MRAVCGRRQERRGGSTNKESAYACVWYHYRVPRQWILEKEKKFTIKRGQRKANSKQNQEMQVGKKEKRYRAGIRLQRHEAGAL